MTNENQKTVYQLPSPDAGWRPLDIQMFAGEGDEQPVDQTPPADTPPIDNGGGKELTPPEKTFTQAEVNNFVKRESSKQQEKMLKELGISDFKDAKEGLAKFKEWQDSQKTEQERQAERLKELETNHGTLTDENSVLKAQISAMKAGVNADYVTDVVTLAKTMVSEDVDMDTAISKVVEKYPHFAQVEVEKEETPKPKFSTGQHQKQSTTEAEAWTSAFK
ncbi:hypothetical protein [Lysinibacillus sp. NPDC086135]|uniref:hypothetical protein n=1 Tax=Lysinibacillus sp. NPDC086135 TaxID=3364130 RepID=UPI00381862E6